MKNYFLIVPAAMLMLASCSPSTQSSTKDSKADSLTTQATEPVAEKGLFAKLQIAENIKAGAPVELKFTVYNNADTVQQFCKWHTPFEPLMSKYLEIKDEAGAEVSYKGPMAKRVMPPPADSYVKVNPKDSLTITVDVLKAYDLTKPAKYTVKYTGQDISGLIVKDSTSFVYGK